MNEPTPGAIRAAKEIFYSMPETFKGNVVSFVGAQQIARMAQIIDEETGYKELIKALEEIISQYDYSYDGQVSEGVINKAKQAIAKAKGESCPAT